MDQLSQGAGPYRGAAAEQSQPESASEDLEGSRGERCDWVRGRPKMLVRGLCSESALIWTMLASQRKLTVLGIEIFKTHRWLRQ